MSFGATNYSCSATIYSDDPAKRGSAPDSPVGDALTIRLAHTSRAAGGRGGRTVRWCVGGAGGAPARARLRATAAALLSLAAAAFGAPACPPARPSLDVGRLFQLAAVALLGLTALMYAAPVEANQPTPGKLALELRNWPHRDYTPEVVAIPGGVVVLAHYQLRWPQPDYPIYEFQFVVDKLSAYVSVVGRWSNVNDEGEHYEYMRVIGPYEAVKTIRVRGLNYRASNNCVGTGPCEGAGEWSDPPRDARRQSPERQVEAPTITGSPALSESGSDGAWTADETVEVTLTFSEAVTVDTTGGTPSVGLTLEGTEARSAPYLRGSGTTALVFGYTLTATDGSHTSLLVPVDSLALNGGTIRSQATSADAALGHSGAAKTGSGGLGTRSEGDSFTARFEGLPASHDGSSAFTFELHFSEAPEGLNYTTVANGLLEVTGASIGKARRLTGGSNLAWEVTMTPSQSGDITITLPPRACSEANAVCAGDRALESAVAATVRGVPFTASFSAVPAEHDGSTAFDIRFHLTAEPASLSFRTVQNGLFAVTGGSIEKASRLVAGKNNGWTLSMAPSGLGDVTVRVNGTTACDTAPGVCTADGRKLPGGLTVSTAGPAVLSVADAEVEEGADATLAFTVTLSKARSATTTVNYATSDGSATAGADYTAQSGTLTFGRLETSKTVSVPVLDDDHDEGSETLTLTLSNVSDNVRLGEATATGTITNSDPLPRALMARFGRTAAVHVVENVEERMQAPREPGFQGRFAGSELRRGMERDFALGFLSQFGGAAGVNGPGAGASGAMAGSPAGGTASGGMPGLGGAGLMGGPSSPGGGLHGGGLLQMGLGGGDILTGSGFSLNRETRQGGILSFWSRSARSYFSGQDGALSLGGDVRTTMFGADYAKGPLVTGLSLSNSRGLSEYAGVTGGQVVSAVTGLYPWLGYKATDRISVWTVAGYGAGGLLLTPESGAALETGLSMAMVAAGTRGELVAGGASGFALAFKADALWVGTSIDGVDGPAGRLKATAAAATRFRTGLEGSRDYTLAGRLSLRPSVEVGLRQDGGDAETGAGMDVGSGLVVSDASTGLTVDVRVRMLVVHQAEGFRERGMALSLSYNPTPSTPLGFVARVAPSWGGAQATSGAEAMWGRETMAGMAHGGLASGNRLDGEVGYGLPVGRRFVGTPRVGFGTSEYGRDYRVGYGLAVLDQESLNLELGVDAQRRESSMQGVAANGFLGRATLGW